MKPDNFQLHYIGGGSCDNDIIGIWSNQFNVAGPHKTLQTQHTCDNVYT